MKKYLKILMISVLLAFCGSTAEASITVQAKLDSVYIQMGRMTTLHLTVTQPKNVKGSLPMLSQLNQSGIIPVCGDSVEFRAPAQIDTLESGNSLTIKYEIPVQSFDSGYYQLPEILYVAGNDTARSKSLSLKVVPVKVDEQAAIYDYASTADPENPSIFDSLPDWLYFYWWVIIIVILLAAAGIYLYKRYRREGHILPKKPEPTPYEAAIASLKDLKEKKLWENGQEKEYYTELTEILRKYLYGRFGINAMEMTSRQILQSLGRNPEIKDKRDMVRSILDMADFVKFAKVRPLPDDNVKSFENALQFVQQTKPVPVEPDKEPEALPKSKGKKNGKMHQKGGRK